MTLTESHLVKDTIATLQQAVSNCPLIGPCSICPRIEQAIKILQILDSDQPTPEKHKAAAKAGS